MLLGATGSIAMEKWNEKKIKLSYDLAIPLLSIYIQNNWNQNLKEIFAHSCSQQHYTEWSMPERKTPIELTHIYGI